MWIAAAAAWLVLVNAMTVERFWFDKRGACAREWRVPESTLLGLALIGGTPGAFAARHLFRHKTRKQPFVTTLYLIAAIQCGLVAGLIMPM